MPEIKSLFSFYYDSAMANIAGMRLSAQLRELAGLKVALLDYCGMASRHARPFRDVDARIFLIESVAEDVVTVLSDYDVVYVMAHETQSSLINFRCILVVFKANSILRIIYQK